MLRARRDVRHGRSPAAHDDSPAAAGRWAAARGRSLPARDRSRRDGDPSCAEGDRFIADDFQSIAVCDRSIADGDESIAACHESIPACNESIVARDRSKTRCDRSIADGDQSIASCDESMVARDRSKTRSDRSIADGDRFIADDFQSIPVGDRSKARNDRFIFARDESSTARDRSIAVGARLISVSSRFIASSAAFLSRPSLVFPDRYGFTEKDEDTIMTTTIKSIHRATITLGIPGKIADLILYATNIVQKLTNNPSFPTPTPTVAVLAAAVNDLHNAETTALSRAKGSATVRNDKRTALVALLQQLDGYVQSVADATPETGAAIIESAGLTVRKNTPRGKRPFAAKPGALSGTVVVTAVAAGQRSSYEWQYSTDGGKTWVFAPATTQGKTTIAGLPSGTTVQFRYLAVTPKGGQGDWSAAVSLLVK